MSRLRQEVDEHQGALKRLRQVAKPVAGLTPNRPGATRRDLVDAIAQVCRARTRVRVLTWVRDLDPFASYYKSGFLSLASEALPFGAFDSEGRPRVAADMARQILPGSKPIQAEDLVGVYAINPCLDILNGEAFFLLADGTFYSEERGPLTGKTYAGHWRVILGLVELKGYTCFTSDCPPSHTYGSFRAYLRFKIGLPELANPLEDEELGRRNETWLFARHRGPDWQATWWRTSRRDDLATLEAKAAALIQRAEATLATSEKKRVKDEKRLVKELRSIAGSSSRGRLVGKQLRRFAAILAEDPRRAEHLRGAVRALRLRLRE